MWCLTLFGCFFLVVPQLARRAANQVVRPFLLEGPERPVWHRNPTQTLALRREELRRAPRPVLQGVVR